VADGDDACFGFSGCHARGLKGSLKIGMCGVFGKTTYVADPNTLFVVLF
jgi:hypothetical protein